MPEVCTNGMDDDLNGLADCADPACAAAFACVPVAPAAWNGPVALYDGDPATAPACPPDRPTIAYQGNGDLIAEPATCDACTCTQPTVTCTPKPISFESDDACGTTSGTALQAAPGVCAPIAPPSGTKAITAAAPAVGVDRLA